MGVLLAAHARAGLIVQNVADKSEKLEPYLKKLEAMYHVAFIYDGSEINKNLMVSVGSKSDKIDDVLKDLPAKAGINYTIVGHNIILKKIATSTTADEYVVVKGRVTTTEKEGTVALPGVNVVIKGSKTGVATNANGEYSIRVKQDAILVFSMVGYKTVERAVNPANTTINITLEPESTALSEVNVIATGYQNLDRKLFTGAATTLKGSEVKRDGIADVSRMLEGRVAGVSVQNVSGTFGAAPKIRVRGATSINGDNKPLWVVDGVVLEDVVNISNEQLSTGDPNTLIGSSVAGLNPDDIENFVILKDAAATAQYGARAMNGVIVVTTKKGKNTSGSPVISYTGNFTSYLKPSYDNYDILNAADQMNVYLEMQNKGWLNHSSTANNSSGGVFTKMYNQMYDYDTATGTYALNNTIPSEKAYLQRYANANTDWFDVLFKNSLMMEHSLSVSSGSEKSQFYASTSFLHDNGWTIGDNVKRFTGNLRGTFKINERLSFELLTQGSVRDQMAPGTLGRISNPVFGQYDRDFDINPFSYALNTSRVLTPYDEKGGLEYFTRDYAPFNIIHELQNNTLGLTQIDFKGQGGVKFKITKDLQYSFDGAYRYAKTNQEHKVTENSNQAEAYRAGVAEQNTSIMDNNRFLYHNPDDPNALPVTVLPYGGFYNTIDDNITNYYFRNALEWNKTFHQDHLVNVYGAQELRYINRQHRTFDGYGYQFDQGGVPFIDPNIVKQNVESNFNYYSMNYSYERYLNYQLRAAYSYKGRYSLNATGRYDGSNLLGESRTARWLPTWNISGAWNLDAERFMQTNTALLKVLNRATLRATYGLTASMGPATNSSLYLQAQNTNRPYATEKETILYIAGLENSELTFEKQKELDLGTDLGFLNDRITLTVDVYDRRGYDLIGLIRTSGIGGEETKVANYADMRSKGVEVTLGAAILKNKNWNWNTQVTFARNTNKITNLKNQPNIFDLVKPDGGAQEGYAQRGLFSIPFLGLDHETGIPYFTNENGEKGTAVYLQSDETKYLHYEGPVDPTITGGYYNSVKYKSFSLSALVTFSAGNKVRLQPIFKSDYTDLDAMSSVFLNRWVAPGDELKTNVPSIISPREKGQLDGYPYNNYNYSTERVADGGFVRLKQVSLGYFMSPAFLRHIGFKNASLTLVANNVWLIYSDKKLNGQDPEFFGAGGVALPIPRQFTLSLKVGF
ncbi:SusC/RagA family TonB-linked outer membrane protein [Chitinophaga costaii]|uniref:SusC/RagA family TonB-linked outer membrane protein n=1 Tax=Chitinophaga costaii TaxID=1335309 RepID=UPI001F0CC7AD|nr:SusC/RagA family TonB-linked outer membrane protein [Chitinophaga costaii]